MTNKLQPRHHGLRLLVIAVLATSFAGCRGSGLSLPKMSMFSWNRKPDAATLAGNTQPSGLPASPAAKYDPAAIASTQGKSTSPTTTTGVGSAYGYGATGTAGGTPAGLGLAASANGYQTGPYQLAPNTSTASTATAGSLPSGSLPSPYGGTYTGSTTSLNTSASSSLANKSDVPLPSSVTAALAKGAAPTVGSNAGSGLPALPSATAGSTTPALPAGYANNGTGQTPASTSAYQMMPSPLGFGSNPYTPSTPVTTVGSLGGTAGQAPTGNSATAGSLTMGLPPFPNQPGTSSAGSTPPPATASTAYQGATTLGSYSPGSTGRSTSYDFSGGQGATTAGAVSPATSLPSVPANSGTLPLLR